VRAPRSAHIAVAPAPATTTTVTIGPIWLTHAIAAPVPEASDAPISPSMMFAMNTTRVQNGMDNIIVGSSETRATNHVCKTNSRNANGGASAATIASRDMAKNPPISLIGLIAGVVVVTSLYPLTDRHEPLRSSGRGGAIRNPVWTPGSG